MTMWHNVTPAILGYALGTVAADVSNTLVEKCADSYDIDEHATSALKMAAHIMAYSYYYSYAYKLCAEWLHEDEQLMPQRQAFEILGLGQYAKEREVQQRYRELALQYHPDKCGTNCDEKYAKMVSINTAYGALKKKFE